MCRLRANFGLPIKALSFDLADRVRASMRGCQEFCVFRLTNRI